MESSKLVISSFKDVALLLARGIDESDLDRISFEGWPTLTIKIQGDHYHGGITPWSAQGLNDIFVSIKKAYSVHKYGTPDLRAVKSQVDKSAFCDFTFNVQEGCTEITSGFTEKAIDALFSMINDGFKSMSATQKFSFLCLFLLSVVGYLSQSRYLESADKQAVLDFQKDQAQQQIEGHIKIQEEDRKLVEKMLSYLPDASKERAAIAQDEIERGQHSFIKKTSDADSITISGQYFDKDAINRVSKGEELDLNYENVEDIIILETVRKPVSGTKGRITGISSIFNGKTIGLGYNLGSINDEDIYKAARNNNNMAIKVSYIAARDNNGEFVHGQITKVEGIVAVKN